MSEASDGPNDNPFSAFPPEALSYLKRAFRVLASVPEHAWPQLVDVAANNYSDHLLPNSRERESWGVNEQDVRPLMVAVRLVVSAAADGSETAEHLFSSGVENGVFEDSIEDPLKKFIYGIFENKEKITATASLRRLASETLPSLTEFDISIEVRLGFGNDDAIERTIPVAILHIDTDTMDKELWLQMSAKELQRIIEKLEETKKRLDVAEKWASQR